jgi:choline-sulfatase/uncharacterized sulfatase
MILFYNIVQVLARSSHAVRWEGILVFQFIDSAEIGTIPVNVDDRRCADLCSTLRFAKQALGGATAAGLVQGEIAIMDEQPNILFVMSDQFNARCFSYVGHPDAKTPNLDRLAADGVRFENAYTQSPICTPSRISFLSGLYPSTHGYYGLYGCEPAQPMTNLFEHFADHGYRTGALGKLHTPRYWIERSCQFVYDEFIEHPKYLEAVGLYDVNDNRRFSGWRDGQASTLPLEHSCEAVLAKQAIRFIRNQGEPADRGRNDAPWLAWVSFSRPHSPLTPSEPFASMYAPDSVTLPPSADLDYLATQPHRIRQVPRTHAAPEPGDVETMLSAYLGLVSQVDYGIGLILDELDSQGLLESTVIVFTADHGDYAGEFGLWSKFGGISTRAITRVPLIVRLPDGARKDVTESGIVETIDLFPSLSEIAKIEMPDHVQGRSFSPLLQSADSTPIRDSALTENARRKAIATREWRYVANIGDQPHELYDQINDPWEMRNVIDDPAYAEIAQDMLRRLLDRIVCARRPITMFDHGAWRHEYDRDGRSPMSPLPDGGDIHD